MKQSRGFSLLEILISISVLGGLALVGGTLVSKFGSQQSSIVGKDESNEFVSSLTRWLPTKEGCEASFLGKDFPLNSETNFSIDGYKGYGISDQLNVGSSIKAGFQLSPKLKVNKLVLRDKGIAPSTQWFDQKKFRKVVAQIEISMDVVEGSSGQTLRSRFIEIPVYLNETTNKIERCSGEVSLSDMCSALGATFDEATGACKPLVNCSLQGTYATLTCDPSKYGCKNATGASLENPITNSQSCPSGSIASQTGVFQYTHQVDCGKKCTKTINNTMKYYICLRCN